MISIEALEPRFMPCTPLNVLQIIETVNAGVYSEQTDINQDGIVSPLDALIAINETNLRSVASSPGELYIQPNSGKSSVTFSPCGETMSLLVLAQKVQDPASIQVQVSGEAYAPVETGQLGKFQSVQFEIWGRGREWLRVVGDIDDELLTIIIG